MYLKHLKLDWISLELKRNPKFVGNALKSDEWSQYVAISKWLEIVGIYNVPSDLTLINLWLSWLTPNMTE